MGFGFQAAKKKNSVVSDIRDEGSLYFACVLYPDTHVCGAYDKPPQAVMQFSLQTAYQKKGKSFMHKNVMLLLQLTKRVILIIHFHMDLKLSKHYNSIHQVILL